MVFSRRCSYGRRQWHHLALPIRADVAARCWVGGRCLALLGWADVTSRCARSRGEPSSAHCEQRLSERLTPCPCDPVCACTGIRGHAGKGNSGYRQTRKQTKGWQNNSGKERAATRISICVPTRSAASRAVMAGWAGEGGGRFGERREYEAPTLPSPPRQHGSARHHTRQPRNSSAYPQTRHATTRARQETTTQSGNTHTRHPTHQARRANYPLQA